MLNAILVLSIAINIVLMIIFFRILQIIQISFTETQLRHVCIRASRTSMRKACSEMSRVLRRFKRKTEAERKEEIFALISNYHDQTQDEARQSLVAALAYFKNCKADREFKPALSFWGYFGYLDELMFAWVALNDRNYKDACNELEKCIYFYPIFQPRILSAIILLLEQFLGGGQNVLESQKENRL